MIVAGVLILAVGACFAYLSQQPDRELRYGTYVGCMDGKCHADEAMEAVIEAVKKRESKQVNIRVDRVTRRGIIKFFVSPLDEKNKLRLEDIFEDIEVSVNHPDHRSKLIALSCHAECAGNPISKEAQIEQMRKTKELMEQKFPGVEVIMFWVYEIRKGHWKAVEVQ